MLVLGIPETRGTATAQSPDLAVQHIDKLINPKTVSWEEEIAPQLERAKQQEAQRQKEAKEAELARQEAERRASIPPPSPAPTAPPPTIIGGTDVWAKLRLCESGGNYSANTGNGFYGAYQFTIPTWNSMGTGYARADLAPPAVQDTAAQQLQARAGWGQWPACAQKLGLLASKPAPQKVAGGPNLYNYGQCTYYVASRRSVPSDWGNAANWYYAAQNDGWAVGSFPQPGSIAWTSAGYAGHVAYVEQVNGNQVLISEMNAPTWNQVNSRWTSVSEFQYIL